MLKSCRTLYSKNVQCYETLCGVRLEFSQLRLSGLTASAKGIHEVSRTFPQMNPRKKESADNG